MFRITFTTVGFPCLSARVKKIVPTAEPANPEKIRKPHVRRSILRRWPSLGIRIGKNIKSMRTCSQQTITSASNNSLSGIRHALSVPHNAAPRPTNQGPQLKLRADGSFVFIRDLALQLRLRQLS